MTHEDVAGGLKGYPRGYVAVALPVAACAFAAFFVVLVRAQDAYRRRA